MVGDLPLYVRFDRQRGGWAARAIDGQLIRVMNDELGLRDVNYRTRREAVQSTLAALEAHDVPLRPDGRVLPLRFRSMGPGRCEDLDGHWRLDRTATGWQVTPLSEQAKVAWEVVTDTISPAENATKHWLARSLAKTMQWPPVQEKLRRRGLSGA